VGAFDSGVARASGDNWERVPTPGPPGALWINSLCWDGEQLWVGSEAGLGSWRAGETSISRVPGFEGRVNAIRCEGGTVVVARSHDVWIKRDAGWEQVHLPNERLHTAVLDGETLWAGGLRGLLRRREGKWTRYSRFNGRLPESWITAALPVEGELWVGTYDGGLVALDQGGMHRMLRAEAWVNPNALARSGELAFVGTMGSGLLVYDSRASRWGSMTTSDGLPSNDVTAILPTGDTIWVGTRGGLVALSAQR
jgi:ligand-binding sensor domain-containing protein